MRCAVRPPALPLDVTEPDWRAAEACALPAPLARWLRDTGSLTAALRGLPGRFGVTLLGPAWQAQDQDWQCRQVLLCLDERPLVWALTRVPREQLDQAPALAGLGDRPLGEWLFSQPDLRREPLVLADFAAVPAFVAALAGWGCPPPTGALWGRRSWLSSGPVRLQLTEVFLPHAPPYEE
ncbi:chorismate lyase [Pseudaeromonas sp. ZJS20]|uniref:chorismate--pyruvate lyase family protein n=1 Tax=Pseudaeromonas aegiceratis TaxID=3153928 RepID=UPI00390CD3D0